MKQQDLVAKLDGLRAGSFPIILADPGWQAKNQGTRAAAGYEGEQRRLAVYQTSPMQAIRKLPVQRLAASDAILFLWRVTCMQEEACLVAFEWGFTVASEIVWCKTTLDGSKPRIGMGNFCRNAHETCLVCTRGKATSLIKDKSIPSWFEAPRRAHSSKPVEFYSLIEKLTGNAGPRIELYAREQRPGYFAWGDEIAGGLLKPTKRRRRRFGE